MKGWIYVITNQAVRGLVRVGATPKDPVAFAEALDKGGLPFPYEVGYEALVPDMDAADKAVAAALADTSEGKGWYACSVVEAVRRIVDAIGDLILLEKRYEQHSRADWFAKEASSSDPQRRIEAISDPDCPLNVLQFVAEREQEGSVLLALASNPAATHPVLDAVTKSGLNMTQVIKAVICNPQFSTDGFEEVLDGYNDELEITRALISRKDCPPKILAKIVHIYEGEEAIRATSFCHPGWSQEVFHALLEEEAKTWPAYVAEYPDCPPALLRRLWDKGDYETRAAVVSNHACPVGILIQASMAVEFDELGADECIEDMKNLAQIAMENPANPRAQALRTVDEPEPDGRHVDPVVRLELLANDTKPEARAIAAGDEDCPPALLRVLAHDGAPDVCSAALLNPKCPKDVLEEFAESDYYEFRLLVLGNPACPASLLEMLALDRNHEVRKKAKKRLGG